MVDLKYAVLGYSNLHQGSHCAGNYGDEIQSIAAARCLPSVDAIIDRNELNQFSSSVKHVLLMNGFFGLGRQGGSAFPPSDDIIPIYFSFHIAGSESCRAFYTSPICLEHFKKWEPIGCRDRSTAELLRSKGISTFFSKCLTLTFGRRPTPEHKSRLFIVDGDTLRIPKYLMDDDKVRRVTHRWGGLYPGQQSNMQSAQHLLDLYRHEADKVITTRLHCALPCRAMGIPVIFMPKTGSYDHGRLSVYGDVGGRMPPLEKYSIVSTNRAFKFFPYFLKRFTQKVESALMFYVSELYMLNFDWQFDCMEFESEKKKIRLSLQEQIKTQLNKL